MSGRRERAYMAGTTNYGRCTAIIIDIGRTSPRI
jgi:hypothetical protein